MSVAKPLVSPLGHEGVGIRIWVVLIAVHNELVYGISNGAFRSLKMQRRSNELNCNP